MANDLTTLTARLTERLGSNSTFWVAAEKADAINEALSCWAACTGEFIATADQNTVIGQFFYPVPEPIVSLRRVLGGDNASLSLTSLAELDRGYPGWEDEAAGTPRLWAPVGINLFAVYPAPNNLTTFTCEGLREAPWLVAGTDVINLGEEELVHILSYAHHVLSFKEGGAEFQSTMPALRAFFEAAALRNERLRSMNFYRRFMGEQREEGLRPDVLPPKTVGVHT